MKGIHEYEYRVCETEGCDNIERSFAEDKPCLRCIESGINAKLVHPDIYAFKMVRDQKSLPRCALLSYNKCIECFETATYFEKQIPRTIMMSSAILDVTREYDVLVEKGYKVSFDKNQKTTTKMLFEPTELDLSSKKNRALIEHHHKMCLCSICKWWIIGNNKQQEF